MAKQSEDMVELSEDDSIEQNMDEICDLSLHCLQCNDEDCDESDFYGFDQFDL